MGEITKLRTCNEKLDNGLTSRTVIDQAQAQTAEQDRRITHILYGGCTFNREEGVVIRGPPSGDMGHIVPFSSIFRPVDRAL